MKIDAGGLLWQRNPINDPDKISNTPATSQCGSLVAVSMMMAKMDAEIKAIPDERESILSRKLKELISPKIQKTEMIAPIKAYEEKMVARTPKKTSPITTPT